MANLKGSSFEKNVKNYLIRANARGTSRHNTNSKNIHSNAVMQKREMYIKDFANYAKSLNLDEQNSKLNAHFTDTNVQNFIKERLEGLSPKSQYDYVSGFNAMINNMKDLSISVSICSNSMENIRSSIENREASSLHSALNNTEAIISSLSNANAVACELMLEQGFRVSEAIEIINNADKYLSNVMTISEVVGKGGQIYIPKEISSDLYYSILNTPQVSYYDLLNELKEFDVTPHDFRYTFAQERFEYLISSGTKYKDALKEVSKQLNHHRESITLLYLGIK